MKFRSAKIRCLCPEIFVEVLAYDLYVDKFQVALNDVGDRKVDQTIQIFQNGKLLPLMMWHEAFDHFEILYDNYSDGAWQGVMWPGGIDMVGK